MKKYFEFCNPVKICAGDGALDNLLYEAENLGMSHPLLLTDETLVRLGVAGRFQAVTGLTDCLLYDRVPADSSVHTVNDIARLYRASRCHGIVALGGGSPKSFMAAGEGFEPTKRLRRFARLLKLM